MTHTHLSRQHKRVFATILCTQTTRRLLSKTTFQRNAFYDCLKAKLKARKEARKEVFLYQRKLIMLGQTNLAASDELQPSRPSLESHEESESISQPVTDNHLRQQIVALQELLAILTRQHSLSQSSSQLLLTLQTSSAPDSLERQCGIILRSKLI